MWPAAFVHLFTALGIVCGLFAALAVLSDAWEAMFAWLGLALIVDGLDGALARRFQVQRHLPRFSGDRLDLVIDYVTYVFVPALALYQAGFLEGQWGLLLVSLILLSSLFHFSDTQSKAGDNSFVGFPAIWNLVAFYVFALGLSAAATALLVLACAALTFVPLKWAHPLRTPLLRPVTGVLVAVWALAAISALWAGFPAGAWSAAALLLPAAYSLALTVYAGWAL
jgi:phosphatidylcholine synthase